MRPLSILILSDRRPGHYHLSEGVAAAIARRRPVSVTKIDIQRRSAVPGRLLAVGLRAGLTPAITLRVGYDLPARELPAASVVISAGGETLAANVAASRVLGAVGIFCGTLRHFAPEDFTLVVSSYERHARLPRHLVTLKPSGFDPDTLAARGLRLAPGLPPPVAGLLIGGASGLFRYRDDEWHRLAQFLVDTHATYGTRWIVSTSRRSPALIADRLQAMAGEAAGPIAEMIDFRSAGAGTLPRLFAGVSAVVVTEDSSTMLSEAVCARLPVVGVAPAAHDFKDEEREYRAYLTRERWIASVPMDRLSPAVFVEALSTVRPLEVNHLDRLADALAIRLPGIMGSDA
ncbi:MAG: ELM1/GtrOC1 family putative glycosyltransferase [Hyphomicrobiaceae bacterium]|nr:ELM1/GtrOC1 family putative glycosyltransferase [Hyphomicrobiaceae bacterium]